MYNQHDHTHCWNKENPPCGQKIKHFECCLCKKQHPEIEEERQKREQVVKCRREHLPEKVHDYRTAEQYDVFIKRRQEQIEWLEELIEKALIEKEAFTQHNNQK